MSYKPIKVSYGYNRLAAYEEPMHLPHRSAVGLSKFGPGVAGFLFQLVPRRLVKGAAALYERQ